MDVQRTRPEDSAARLLLLLGDDVPAFDDLLDGSLLDGGRLLKP